MMYELRKKKKLREEMHLIVFIFCPVSIFKESLTEKTVYLMCLPNVIFFREISYLLHLTYHRQTLRWPQLRGIKQTENIQHNAKE